MMPEMYTYSLIFFFTFFKCTINFLKYYFLYQNTLLNHFFNIKLRLENLKNNYFILLSNEISKIIIKINFHVLMLLIFLTITTQNSKLFIELLLPKQHLDKLTDATSNSEGKMGVISSIVFYL